MALRPKLFVTVYINVFILRNINKDLITINYIVLVNLLANISMTQWGGGVFFCRHK